jgi:catechol 2,3-dioxygenase-like lactoylglutathione lyase family enzyme
MSNLPPPPAKFTGGKAAPAHSSGIRIALITLLVPEYDTGIAFYRDKLGFSVREDKDMGGGKRWVVVAPSDDAHAPAFLLAKAADPSQQANVGAQTGSRVAFFLHTDDFDRDYARFRANGVQFDEAAPRQEPYGKVIVFKDAFGNKFDLIQPVALAFPALPSGAAPFTSSGSLPRPKNAALAAAKEFQDRQGNDLTQHNWFHGKISAEVAYDIVKETNQNGAFLVRCSSRPGHFVITWLDNGTIVHTLASPTDAGYAVEGDAQKYESIPQLVELYAAHLTTAVSRV